MKKMLTMLLALLMLLTALPVQAEQMHNPIPQEILALFDVPAWDNYYIPTVTDHPNYYAFTKTDEIDGYCAGLIILREEREQRNVLCLLEKKDGKWRITARNHEALPRGEMVPYLYCEMNDQLEVHWGDVEAETGGALYFSLVDGQWLLSHVMDMPRGIWAYPHEKGILYYRWWNEGGMPSEESAYGIFDRRFAAFNLSDFPTSLEAARERLTNPPKTPSDFYTPVKLTLRAGEKYDVFAAPGRSSLRSGNGKAVMSTNDWVQIFGEEDGWLLVQYDISADQMRFGYIDASALPRGKSVQQLTWYDLPEQTVNTHTKITDDPTVSFTPIMWVDAGDKVKVLAEYGACYYVEAQNTSGKPLRGFILKHAIDLVTWDDLDK